MSVGTTHGSRRHVVANIGDLPPGERLIVQIGRRSIGVYNVDGVLYALANVCPHQGAPLCLGTQGGAMLGSRPRVYEFGREGMIVRYPWHGFAFGIDDGRALADPDAMRVQTYDVHAEGDDIVIYIGRRPVRTGEREDT
jgi:nitrite reductase (NADH) small subunit